MSANTSTSSATHRTYSFGEFTLDLDRGALLRANQHIKLRPKSFEVLRYLVERPGLLISRDELLDAIWGQTIVTEDAVTQCLRDIRTALRDQSQEMIRTVPRRGYIFELPVTASEAPSRSKFASRWPRWRLVEGLVLVLGIAVTWWSLGDRFFKPPVTVAPPEQSIAVLPFSNRSALAEDAYFVDGIHDDILMQLAKLSSFEKVISRTSMEQYRETNKTMRQIGQELGVATILEGGVQRAGDRVRINVQLIEAATDKHLWAETYDRQLTVENIFWVQEEIARAVTGSLRVTLTPEEHDRLAKLPTSSLEAYRLYQLGYKASRKGTAESNERSIGYLEEAIRADPEYAQAYAQLASAYVYQHFVGGRNRQEALKQARPLAERAIQLDPALAQGYLALGLVNTWDRQLAAAESNVETAIALNPGLAAARMDYGILLERLGRLDEAIIQFEAATRLSPLEASFYSMLAYTYARANRSQDALDTLQHALELDPDKPFVYETFGNVL